MSPARFPNEGLPTDSLGAELAVMRPQLPTAEQLLPYLRRLDDARQYTNFGALQIELVQRLIDLQPNPERLELFAVCTSSATLGLELALSALALPPGSRVGIPSLTFPATATATIRSGHIPVALDIDSETWMLTPQLADSYIGLVNALIPVATFGMPQDAKAWSDWSEINGVPVIIDAASAMGAQPIANNVPVVFSLHATKPLSAGEGGVVVTNDQYFAERIRKMANFGIGLQKPAAGTNAKLSEYHAAVGLASCDVWTAASQQRIGLYQTYRQRLARAAPGWLRFQRDTGLVAPCVLPTQFASDELRREVEVRCALEQIGTRRWYQPLIQNQHMLGGVESPRPTPEADFLERTLLGLPFSLGMQDQDVERVAMVIESITS
jgi:dTDP-4-amino-4,6-dideoxygalactose transaminase